MCDNAKNWFILYNTNPVSLLFGVPTAKTLILQNVYDSLEIIKSPPVPASSC